MFEEKKLKQKQLIESIASPQPWVKQEIITICDEQISRLPVLDASRFVISIRSFEHPDGFALGMDVHPCLRIREGLIVRDTAKNPEGFFWPDATYQKMKKKASKNYYIGTDTGEYLENYFKLRNRLVDPEDGRQLSFKVAARKTPLEVFELPAEQRLGVLVTEEIAAALNYRLLESYNDTDENDLTEVCVGDLLVQDIFENEPYYLVNKKMVEETYREGTL